MHTILGRDVGPVGYGLMGLTWRSDPPSTAESFELLHTAIAAGANLFNGGEIYGSPDRHSCHLLHEFFQAHPEQASKVLLSVKGGFKVGLLEPDCSEGNLRRSVDECNRVLGGVKKIDIFQCARVDPQVPIEETMRVLVQLVEEGKIGGIGLSEVNASTIRRAHKIRPIAAVEVELSLWTTDILHNGVADACFELGVPIIAYGPLSRGALTEAFATSNKDIPIHRRNYPRFQDGILEANLKLTAEVARIGERKACKAAQIALAWIQTLSSNRGTASPIIPIPGAEKSEWIRENSAQILLSEEEMQELESLLKKHRITGDRFMNGIGRLVDLSEA